MTGLNTFNSKCPFDPAIDTAVWLPMTCAHTMVSASHCVGLTLPGIIEEPGSLAGSEISPIPQRGPEPNKRMSFAIFMRDVAITFSMPDSSTIASCAARASNLFGAVLNGRPVNCSTFCAKLSANPFVELIPVPTAVPPCANSMTRGMQALMRSIPYFTCWV